MLIGTLERVETVEKDVFRGPGETSSVFNSGGCSAGDATSTADMSGRCDPGGLTYVKGLSCLSSGVETASRSFGDVLGVLRFAGEEVTLRDVEELRDDGELLRPSSRPLGRCEGSGDRNGLLWLDCLGCATMISSSMTVFAGIRVLGIVKGLKKSLMLRLLMPSFLAVGMASQQAIH